MHADSITEPGAPDRGTLTAGGGLVLHVLPALRPVPRAEGSTPGASIRESAGPPSAPGSPELTVLCFGQMRVWRGDVGIDSGAWQSFRAKLALAFLLHHPEGATKARLAEALFGSRITSTASLHMNMMRMRKALEPALDRRAPSRFISRRDGLYTFNRQVGVWIDTWALEAALCPRPGAPAPEESRRLLGALDLYRGEFMPEYDLAWVVALRQRYRNLALAACSRLLELLGDRDARAAVEVAQRALEIDPFAGEFHRELILRYLEGGEPRRALDHYRLCERRYRESLGMEPPADLVGLVAGTFRNSG